jgi:putative transposase
MKFVAKWVFHKPHFFNWKKKFGGLGLTELRKLKQLEEENNQLKKLVA